MLKRVDSRQVHGKRQNKPEPAEPQTYSGKHRRKRIPPHLPKVDWLMSWKGTASPPHLLPSQADECASYFQKGWNRRRRHSSRVYSEKPSNSMIKVSPVQLPGKAHRQPTSNTAMVEQIVQDSEVQMGLPSRRTGPLTTPPPRLYFSVSTSQIWVDNQGSPHIWEKHLIWKREAKTKPERT